MMPDPHSAPEAAPAGAVWSGGTLLAGACLAVQARMNGELATVVGRGLDAALWSFCSGLAVLTLLAALLPAIRRGFRSLRSSLRERRIRVWQCIGGVIGGLYVFCQAYAVPLVGVALFTIATVGAQTASAVVVDRAGVGPAGRVPVSWMRVGAAVLAGAGVVVAVGGRVSDANMTLVVPVVLAVVVGALTTLQQGLNGRVTVATGNPFSTTWLNFASGAAVLLLLALPARSWGAFGAPVALAAPWWAWFGGLFGIAVVGISAVAVRHLGVLLVMVLMLAGQLVAAVGLDALDARTRGHITPLVVLGIVMTLAGAGLAGAAGVRRSRALTRT